MMDTVMRRLRHARLLDGFGLALVLAASLFLAAGTWTVLGAESPPPQLVAHLEAGR